MDYYTKVILTIIALSLVVIAGENATSRAMAQYSDVQKVQICDSPFQCVSLRPSVEFKSGATSVTYELPVTPSPNR